MFECLRDVLKKKKMALDRMMKYLLVLIGVCVTTNAAPATDEVTSLPGWDGSLPSKMYSGYVDVGDDKSHHMHYVFIESENEPSNDPVILWVQGGPGGSSMEGCN
jgi:serine carboxypeptidase-like clade I